MRPASNRSRPRLLALLLALAAPVVASQTMDDDLLDDDPPVARILVCYGYGCSVHKDIYVFESDFAPVRGELAGSRDAADERRRIARAVGLMESLVGTRTPTANDLPGNEDQRLAGAMRGQMDCIDEARNTSAYLALFERLGLLRWHRVERRVLRAPLLLDQHWAAQILETDSGRRFAVDSWVRGNGEPAIVQPLEEWTRDRPVAVPDGRV